MAAPFLVARSTGQNTDVNLLPKLANRHGLITGATGTGKTVSLQVLAEGVQRPDDLEAVWALGFDGAAGPAVQVRAAACEPA